MRSYWLDVLLITLVFSAAMAFTLVRAADNAGGTAVYGSGGTVLETSAQAQQNQSNMHMAVGPRGTTIVIQPLDAPGNPYVGQYSEYDRWVYNNLDTQFSTKEVIQSGLQNVAARQPIPVPAGDTAQVQQQAATGGANV